MSAFLYSKRDTVIDLPCPSISSKILTIECLEHALHARIQSALQSLQILAQVSDLLIGLLLVVFHSFLQLVIHLQNLLDLIARLPFEYVQFFAKFLDAAVHLLHLLAGFRLVSVQVSAQLLDQTPTFRMRRFIASLERQLTLRTGDVDPRTGSDVSVQIFLQQYFATARALSLLITTFRFVLVEIIVVDDLQEEQRRAWRREQPVALPHRNRVVD